MSLRDDESRLPGPWLHVPHRRWARLHGIIPRNPAAGDRKQKGHRRKVPTPWTIDQARTFFAYVENSPYRPIFLLAAYAGPREGEILGLGIDDLDLERGRAILDSTLIRVDSTPR
jgi:integrase